MSDNKNSLNDKLLDLVIEEAVEKYSHDIADENISCDMTDEEIKIMEEQKDTTYKNVMKDIRKEKKPHGVFTFKKCTALVACLVVVFSLALNVSAFRIFIFKTYTDMKGTVLNIKTAKITNESYAVIKEFENRDELIIPGWLPPGMNLAEITDDFLFVILNFEGEETWLTLHQDKIFAGEINTSVETEKNVFSVDDYSVMNMDGKLIEIRSESGITMLKVIWNSDETRYELSTNVDRTMLEAILSSLKYAWGS